MQKYSFGKKMIDCNFCTFAEIKECNEQEYIAEALRTMESRFTSFLVTPEQQKAWRIGFAWIYKLAVSVGGSADSWIILPEYSAPLISGRPDLVIVTVNYLLVIEMKTGVSNLRSSGSKQVIEYSNVLWGTLKAARDRVVLPILLSNQGKQSFEITGLKIDHDTRVQIPFNLNINGLSELLKERCIPSKT